MSRIPPTPLTVPRPRRGCSRVDRARLADRPSAELQAQMGHAPAVLASYVGLRGAGD